MRELPKHSEKKGMRDDKGYVFIMVLTLLMVASLLVTPMLGFMATGAKTGVIYRQNTEELAAADAGVEDGVWQIRYDKEQDFPGYSPYDYTASWGYQLPELVNGIEVNVAIQNSWIPRGLTPPSQANAERIILGIPANPPTPAKPPKVILTGGIPAPSTFNAKIQYYFEDGEDLGIATLGVWLPPGFNYDEAVASNLDGYWSSRAIIPHAGGEAIVWTFTSYPFAGDGGSNDPFPGVNPGDNPMVSNVSFQFTGPANRSPEPISWIDTNLDLTQGGSPSVGYTWDAGSTVYKIASVAGETEIEAYTTKGELRRLGSTIGGDFLSIGNTLMTPTDSQYYRAMLFKESSATVDANDIPDTAFIDAAWLYWSGWIEAAWETIWSDECSTFDNWTAGSAWEVYATPIVITNSPSSSTGGWSNASSAYSDGGGYAYMTSSTPSANETYGTYGFSLAGKTITQVRARWDALTAGASVPVTYLYDTGDNGDNSFYSNYKMGQTFSSSTPFTITSASALLYRTGGYTGTITAEIYSTTGSPAYPTGSALTSGTTNGGTLPTASPYEWRSISLTPYALSAGTTYALVLSASGGSSGTSPRWRYDGTSPTYSNGMYGRSSSGGSWSTGSMDSSRDNMFRIYGNGTEYNDQIRVDVSWDGGTSWSSKTVQTLTSNETTYWFDFTSATSWTPDQLSDANLKVRADAYTQGTAEEVRLDWLPVEVTYTDVTSAGSFRGFAFGKSSPGRYLATSSNLDLSSYASESVTLTFQYWENDGSQLESADRLQFQLSGNGGGSWGSLVTAFADDLSGGATPVTYNYTVPSQYRTSQFRMRFYLDGFSESSEVAFVDNVQINVPSTGQEAIQNAKVNRVMFNGIPITAEESQAAPTNVSGAPNSLTYSNFFDATGIVRAALDPGTLSGTFTLGHWLENGPNSYALYDAQTGLPTGDTTGYPLGTPAVKVGGSYPSKYQWTWAGWSLVIIYSSPETEGHQLYLFDTLRYIALDTELTFTINNFLAPNDTTGSHLTYFVGEGDNFYAGDSITLNGSYLSDAVNPWNNAFNSYSNLLDNPSLSGVDIDDFDVSSLIQPDDSSAVVVLDNGSEIYNLVYIILSFRSSRTTGNGTITYLIKG